MPSFSEASGGLAQFHDGWIHAVTCCLSFSTFFFLCPVRTDMLLCMLGPFLVSLDAKYGLLVHPYLVLTFIGSIRQI